MKVNYDSQETEQFIQTFFSARKNAMIDLINSMLPLFGNAQCVGMKNASPEMLRKMEELLDVYKRQVRAMKHQEIEKNK